MKYDMKLILLKKSELLYSIKEYSDLSLFNFLFQIGNVMILSVHKPGKYACGTRAGCISMKLSLSEMILICSAFASRIPKRSSAVSS